MTFFCPRCGATVEATASQCPACAFDFCAHGANSYEQKLILALAHPVREHRMIAIQVLGELQSTAAVKPLKEILAAESDYVFLREVLTSLTKIGSPESRAAVAAAAWDHPSRLVRRFASRLLGGTGS